jgi:hypothetical protein
MYLRQIFELHSAMIKLIKDSNGVRSDIEQNFNISEIRKKKGAKNVIRLGRQNTLH